MDFVERFKLWRVVLISTLIYTISITSIKGVTTVETCPTGWHHYLEGHTCVRPYGVDYYNGDYTKTWSEARVACKTYGGPTGDLVMVKDEKKGAFLKGVYDKAWFQGWFGAYRSSTTQEFVWRDGTAITYKNWNTYEPNNSGGNEGCAIFVNNQMWNDLNCYSSKEYVCERDADMTSCPDGYSLYMDGTTCIKLSDDSKSWEAARLACQANGGDLATIQNSETNKFVTDLVSNKKATYWIGLSDRQKENVYRWLMNSSAPAEYVNWAQNEPNDKDGKSNCVQLNGGTDNKWMSYTCSSSARYICQAPATVNGKKAAVARPALECPDGWRMYDGHTCIKLYTDKTTTWVDARSSCQMQGADLVKIGDDTFEQFVRGMVYESGTSLEPYIGLSDRSVAKHFRWLDETQDATYTLWHTSEPSMNEGDTHCVVIVVNPSYNFRWNDVDCTSSKAYICQQAAKRPGTKNCGPGWEDAPNTDFCLRFNPEALSWHDAKDSCSLFGGDLASVVKLEDMLYLQGKVQSIVTNSDSLWTGGNDKFDGVGWRWTDGGPFAFINWDSGEPKNNHTDNCLAMFKDNGRWSAENCLDRMASICKKLGKGTSYPAPTSTMAPTNIPSDKVWDCPPGWYPFRGSCYKGFTSSKGIDWNAANKACKTRNSNLVAITDFQENQLVFSMLPEKFGFTWTGLNNAKSTKSFAWSDGVTPMTYTNWDLDQPSIGGGDSVCGQIIDSNGRWAVQSCDVLGNYLVCKRNKYIYNKADFKPFEGCSKGGVGLHDKCYVRYKSLKTFDAAQKTCEGLGGNLATISDRYTQAYVSSLLTSKTYWIGLSNTKQVTTVYPNTKWVYSWKSGANYYFTHWDRSHTGKETNMCVGMTTTDPVGMWHSYQCSTKNKFTCEYPRPGFSTPQPIPTTTSTAPCPPGWFEYGQMCYKFMMKWNQEINWMEAKAYCGKLVLGGTLACVTSSGLQDKMATEFLKTGWSAGDVWIGLSDRDAEGGHQWVDGQPLQYTNWNSGEPNNANQREDCVEMAIYSQSSTGWNDNSCYKQHNFVCQAHRGAQVLTTVTSPTVGSTSSVCGGGSWTMFQGNCFQFNAGWYDPSSWYAARTACHAEGAELASIADTNENGYIAALMNKEGVGETWIGLSDLDGDVYKWVDGTPAFFFSWNKGEPNDVGGERCAVIHADGGWNDLNCNSEKSYVCKKKPGSTGRITVAPKLPPKGGCPHKFTGVPGTSQCFYVGGVNPEDRLTLDQATAKCGTVYPKSRLASIHNLLDEEVVMTLIAGLKVPAWIGLRDDWYSEQFRWIDNTERDYVHWGRNEPGDWYDRSECVDMVVKPKYAGDWKAVECSRKLAYVCEFRKDVLFPPNQPSTYGCPSGYQRFRNSCYKLNTILQSWSTSETQCMNDGGHLVSIQGGFEAAYVDLLLASKNLSQVWIGLADNSGVNAFTWSDTWPVLYTVWGQGQPDLSKYCVANNRREGKGSAWSTRDCRLNIPSICEINKDPAPYPTPSLPGKCPNNQWTQQGDFCYLLEYRKKKSWPEANYDCGIKGGVLASIHNPSDFRAVAMYIGLENVDAWIGLHQSGMGSYEWSDKSEVEYFSWSTGYPTLANDSESCVLAQGSDAGKWMDTGCYSKHAYICKIKQIPLSTTPTPTTSTTTTTTTTTQPPKVVTKDGGETLKPKSTRPSTTASTTTPQPQTTTQSTIATQGKVSKQKSGSGDDSSGLSGGAIAGIVIGVLALVVINIAVIFYIKRRADTQLSARGTSGFDNAVYNNARDNDRGSVEFKP